MVKTTQEMSYNYFMKTDVSMYIGEWSAVSDNKILAHGKNVKEFAAQAQKIAEGKKFLLARVPSEETMIF